MNRHNDALRTGGRPVERDDSALRALVARDSRRWTRLATTQAARRSLITSPDDLPPSARKAIRHLKQHRALASYCTNFNLIENRVSVANFGDCPRTPLRDERGGWRTRGLFQLAAVREATVRNQWRTPRHDRLSEAACLGVRGAAMLKKPVWASSRLARRVPLPRIEPHVDKAGKQHHKAKGE